MHKTDRVLFWLSANLILGVLLIVLRLTGAMAVSWWLVLAPFWVPCALLLLLPLSLYTFGKVLEQIEQ